MPYNKGDEYEEKFLTSLKRNKKLSLILSELAQAIMQIFSFSISANPII
jgi:hypothetical protein